MLSKLFRPNLIIGTLPVTLANGTTADATQVMSDLNYVVNQVNANAAPLASPTFTGTVTATAASITTLTVSGSETVPAGTGTGTIQPSGLISSQTSAAGIGNGADATDDTLFTYSLPLNSLSANGKAVRVHARGSFAPTGHNVYAAVWFAGVDLVAGTLATAVYNGGFDITVEVARISSTKVSAVATIVAPGTALVSNLPNQTVADLTANASEIKLTGKSGSSVANDVLGYGMTVTFLN